MKENANLVKEREKSLLKTGDLSKKDEKRKKSFYSGKRPIDRLRVFAVWAKLQDLCASESDFEQKCKLSSSYIYNNSRKGKGNINSEVLGRIIIAFPQLNLDWICTGEGAMLKADDNLLNKDYKKAYEGAVQQVEALTSILRKAAASSLPIASPLP